MPILFWQGRQLEAQPLEFDQTTARHHQLVLKQVLRQPYY